MGVGFAERRLQRARESELSFLLGTHPRCGAASPILLLPSELVHNILNLHWTSLTEPASPGKGERAPASGTSAMIQSPRTSGVILGGAVQAVGRSYADFW